MMRASSSGSGCRAFGVALVAVALGVGGASPLRASTSPPSTAGAGAPSGDEVIVRISVAGGLVPASLRVRDTVPLVWVGARGRHIRQADDADASPALPRLVERPLARPALGRLLAAARRAGLLDPDPDYGKPQIFDATSTFILVVADGAAHDVAVAALGYPVTDLDTQTTAARARVSRFVELATHPRRLGASRDERPHVPRRVAVFVLGPARDSQHADPPAWPLGDLATIGEPVGWPTPSARCLVVADGDVRTLRVAAKGVTSSTPWRSGDTLWDVALRPLLPDERTCSDVVSPREPSSQPESG